MLKNAKQTIFRTLSRHFGENTDFKIQAKGCVFLVPGNNQDFRSEYWKISFWFDVFDRVKTLKNPSIFAGL